MQIYTQIIKKWILCIFALCFVFSLSAKPPSHAPQNSDPLISAERFINLGKWSELNTLKAKLKTHPLYPYIVYKELNAKLYNPKKYSITLEDIQRFVSAHAGQR